MNSPALVGFYILLTARAQHTTDHHDITPLLQQGAAASFIRPVLQQDSRNITTKLAGMNAAKFPQQPAAMVHS